MAKAHWRAGHKALCDFYSLSQERAAAISGNPSAWSDLATFVKYHHATLLNATIACYLRTKADIPDVTSSFFLQINLLYRNDPSLPPHKKFEARGMGFTHKDDPSCPSIYPILFAQRPAAVEIGKKEFGREYWGTGAYLLMLKFREGEFVGAVPFWKHFGIDKWRGNAKLACKHPWDQLKETIEDGRKPLFCCG